MRRYAPPDLAHRGADPVPLDAAGVALRADYLRWRKHAACPSCGADAGRPCVFGCLMPTQWHGRHRLVLALQDAAEELAANGHVCWIDDTYCSECGEGGDRV